MTALIHPADTDGSPAALAFCSAWADLGRQELKDRTELFAKLRAEGVAAAVQNDAWANKEPGHITLFFSGREYQYVDTCKLYFGAKIALLSSYKVVRYLNLLEPAPTWWDLIEQRRLIAPQSGRFKCMPFDPNKEFWSVNRSVTAIDEVEYFIRDKPQAI